MKTYFISIVLLLSVLVMSSNSYGQDRVSSPGRSLSWAKTSGLTPEVFAPGIVSTEHHEWGAIFSPDMKEFYFSRRNNKSGKDSHFVLKSENNRWHESEVEPGVGGSISPDGKTMFFTNQYRERTDEGWSEFKSLGSAFEDFDIMRLTTSSKGTYVFDEYPKEGNFVLRYSRLINGKREAPKLFSKEINTGKQNVHPFIAPDESYILWDSKEMMAMVVVISTLVFDRKTALGELPLT